MYKQLFLVGRNVSPVYIKIGGLDSSQRQQSGTSTIWGLTHHRTIKEKTTALNCDCVYN